MSSFFTLPILILLLMSVFDVSNQNVFAVDFVDRTGYIPEWAKNIGQQQAIMTCSSVDYGTADMDWCSEYSGYILDQMNAQLIEKEQSSNDNQLIDKPTSKPQFNTNLFPDVKYISHDAYVNKPYKFSLEPPINWSVEKNAKLLGDEEAAIVAFNSDDWNPTYTSNFIISYKNLGSDMIQITKYSDNAILDEFTNEYALETSAKILEKEIESYNDGYKISEVKHGNSPTTKLHFQVLVDIRKHL